MDLDVEMTHPIREAERKEYFSCQNPQNSNGENLKFIGCEVQCTNLHTRPVPDPCLSSVKWLELGTGKLRDLTDWVIPSVRHQSPLESWVFSWSRFIESLSSEDKMVLRFPGIDCPLRAGTMAEFHFAMWKISCQFKADHRLWCQAVPPTVIVCTAYQYAKLSDIGWANCLNLTGDEAAEIKSKKRKRAETNADQPRTKAAPGAVSNGVDTSPPISNLDEGAT